MTWELLETGFLPGEINMSVDGLLAHYRKENPGNPILRLYGWKPPAISIGYNQDRHEFDERKLSAEGIDLVRRPTGGRAILHWNELTYSVVIMKDEKSLYEIYHDINRALLEGVRILGINAELVNLSHSAEQMYFVQTSAACFCSSAKSEIRALGRKLLGSAQRRFGQVVLQHGSLLLDSRHLQLVSYLVGNTAEKEKRTLDRLTEYAIDANTASGRAINFEEAKSAIITGFERELGIVFKKLSPSFLDHLLQQNIPLTTHSPFNNVVSLA